MELKVKNVQIIDGALNCVYDIFSMEDDEFNMIFPPGTNIAFIDEIYLNDKNNIDIVFRKMWKNPVSKSRVNGIDGTIFYDMDHKKIYYPTRRDEEAINPDGTSLR